MKANDLRVWMVDPTLRDGEQAPGVFFRPLEKLTIASQLVITLAHRNINIDAAAAANKPVSPELLESLYPRTLCSGN